MKIYTYRIIVLIVFIGFLPSISTSQTNPNISAGLPQIVSPAPTVSSLMRFEEIPVSNYTGTPNVSIPLFSTATYSKDVNLDLSLKYHPSSVAPNEVAGFTGLGWSLFAGGTISRTVKGLPDEINEAQKKGIYSPDNKYYQVLGIVSENTPSGNAMIEEYYYDTEVKGKYDTEHDLYQFSFMGRTGRFYIKKVNGQFQIIMLESESTIKITYNSTTKVFTLFDEKDNKYIFDVHETTTTNTAVENIYFNNQIDQNIANHTAFISAFHLSEVRDANNQLLIKFHYNTQPIVEGSISRSSTFRSVPSAQINDILAMLMTAGVAPDQIKKFDPKQSTNVSTNITQTKKIDYIAINGRAKINFILEQGRQDTDLEGHIAANKYRLKEILVRTWDSVPIKKISLQYSYSDVRSNRMLLSSVDESNFINTEVQSHQMWYKGNSITTNVSFTNDHWGFLTMIPRFNNGIYREPNPALCTIDVLQKMKIPSGGAIVFDFESNTYSHIGDQPISNFDENPDNWIVSGSSFVELSSVSGNPGVSYTIPSSFVNRTITMVPVVLSGQPGIFTLSKNIPNAPALAQFSCGINGNVCTATEVDLLPNTEYKLTYSSLNTGTTTGGVEFLFKQRNRSQSQFLYGGGIRIKNIGYFDHGEVPQSYFDFISYREYDPNKLISYNYNFFDTNKSSGSLSFPKPLFQYLTYKESHIENFSAQGHIIQTFLFDLTYENNTSFNNLISQRTHGSDVGYQNVTVSETGNGKTTYVYTSPIDNPEEDYSLVFPFVQSKNIDYKRGLLLNQKIYREGASQPLTETLNIYDANFDQVEERTGLRFYTSNSCPYLYKYSNFDLYYGKVTACASQQISYNCHETCAAPTTFINFKPIIESSGWPKLIQKINREYLVGGVHETKETFSYNEVNKKIATHSREVYVSGSSTEKVQTNYYYLSAGVNNISNIKHIENFRNNTLIGAQRIDYSNAFPGNVSYLPSIIQESKGTQALENKLLFLRYDAFGNPLELKVNDGNPMVYIWGYNNSQPVAMIENASFNTIPTNLINAAQNATTEPMLLSALVNLRNSLPEAMVTSYTYKPLVGVSSITDPKGIKTSYDYDAFGRLTQIRDSDNNIISENQYHYRP